MQALKFAHVLSMAFWFGTVASEIILEVLLWKTKSAAKQRAYIDLHRILDVVVELPALLLTFATGALLMWRYGYFNNSAVWPAWLEDKLIAASVAVAVNLICMVFVQLRARRTDDLIGTTMPLASSGVRGWHLAVSSTALGFPFGLIALWMALSGRTFS